MTGAELRRSERAVASSVAVAVAVPAPVPVSVLDWAAGGVAALAWSDLHVWGAALGWLVGSVLRVRRAHVEAAMARAGVARPSEAAAAMYASLGTSAIEFLWMAGRGRSLAQYTHIDAESSTKIDVATQRGHGIVFAASHTGNWDLAACAIARRMPLMVVTKRLSVGLVDAFWQHSRASYGVTLVEANGAMKRAHDHLARGGAVAMMIDQVPARMRHGKKVSFLGADAWVDRAPFALAAESQASVLVSAAYRDEGVAQMRVIDAFDPPMEDRVAWISSAAERATHSLDAFVREHPTQWLWMHRRWKDPLPLAALAEHR